MYMYNLIHQSRTMDERLRAAFSFVDRDIREGEIRSFSQQRFAGRFGEGVREAVTEVEGRRVAAFSVSAPRGAGEIGLFSIYGNDLKINANDEEIEFAAGSVTATGFKNDAGFEHTRSGDEASRGSADVLVQREKWRRGQRYQ